MKPSWLVPCRDELRAAWHLRAHTALLLSLDAAQVLPDPKNKGSTPLYFLLVEPRTWTTGMFHLFLTAETLLQAPGLWGWRGCSLGAVLQGAQGQAASMEK